MGIKIYTYANPYEINRESYWNEIKDCAHFCVSQTMVNGLEDIYHSLKEGGYLTTIRILLNTLYSDWEDMNICVRQIMEADNAINSLVIEEERRDNVRQSLEYNVKPIVSCIRLFKELGLSPDCFDVSRLNTDQKYLVEIYKTIFQRKNSSFEFNQVTERENIDKDVIAALKTKHKDNDYKVLNNRAVVIHGIHQFSPAMLCAIEDISRYKDVILLFNYQEQYKTVYQTWLNIYSLFEKKIIFSTEYEFKPVSLYADSYFGNKLADDMGKLANDNISAEFNTVDMPEIIEFENLTEFAGYCAKMFEAAKNIGEKTDKTSVLYNMPEQLYSASGRVNDILRAYFPEQFGERHFLDYPIGHFFVSMIDMWDNENRTVKVDNMSNIKECLEAGIISEKKPGQLLNTFNTVEEYIKKENTLDGILSELKRLRKYVSPSKADLKRIGYLNTTKQDIDDLRDALTELNKIVIGFFKDFENGGDNFNRFYKRIHDFIVKRLKDAETLDEEMKNIIARLLERMNNIDLPDTGTFTCLKETMSFYLSQDDRAVYGANWIVRNFEQIDGDILRSAKQKADKTCYHFCCLSDKDMCADKDERLPWPLYINFFEYSYEPLEMKYRIFLKSKMEFKNFKRYALLYGLEFNRVGCKLSYVKSENHNDNELYHILKILGIKVNKYHSDSEGSYIPYLKYENKSENVIDGFTFADKIKYLFCPYRFVLEGLVQEGTIYRERFLVIFYLRILLQNNIIKKYKNMKWSNDKLKKIINDEYLLLDDAFHISNEFEKTQIISGVYQYIERERKNNKGLLQLFEKNKIHIDLNEDFLVIRCDDLYDKVKDINLAQIIENKSRYYANYSKECMYCSSKDVCLRMEQ